MTRFILIRHGETDWNIEGRWQGQADVPLNERGREQAIQTADALAGIKFAAIYSSDLSRARDTAEVLASVAKLKVQFDVRLREIHQGEWQGLLISEIRAKYADAIRLRMIDPISVVPPGGETTLQVMERVVAAIEDIRQKYSGQTVAVVSHGFAIACLLVHYQNLPIERIWDLIPENGGWREIEVN